MKLALTLFEPLFQRRTLARRSGLAFINWLSGLCLGRHSLTGHSTGSAGALRPWTSGTRREAAGSRWSAGTLWRSWTLWHSGTLGRSRTHRLSAARSKWGSPGPHRGALADWYTGPWTHIRGRCRGASDHRRTTGSKRRWWRWRGWFGSDRPYSSRCSWTSRWRSGRSSRSCSCGCRWRLGYSGRRRLCRYRLSGSRSGRRSGWTRGGRLCSRRRRCGARGRRRNCRCRKSRFGGYRSRRNRRDDRCSRWRRRRRGGRRDSCGSRRSGRGPQTGRFGSRFPSRLFLLGLGSCRFFGRRQIMEMLADSLRGRYVDRAGVSLLFGDASLGKIVNDGLRLDLKFSRQLVNSNLRFVCHSGGLRLLLFARPWLVR